MKKDFLLNQWKKAKEKNNLNILNFCEVNPNSNVIDLGCDNGSWTIRLGKKIKTKNLFGIEINDESISSAIKNGIIIKKGDLNKKIPFPDEFFDTVHSNQVIEHLINTDNFIEEMYRILKPGGYVVTATENISGFDNVIGMVLGQQAFSQHISSKWNIGNRFSPHYGNKMGINSWTHRTIFSYYGIQQLFKKFGFKEIKIRGAGHFPLPLFFDYLDPIHCHFITIKAKKPKQNV